MMRVRLTLLIFVSLILFLFVSAFLPSPKVTPDLRRGFRQPGNQGLLRRSALDIRVSRIVYEEPEYLSTPNSIPDNAVYLLINNMTENVGNLWRLNSNRQDEGNMQNAIRQYLKAINEAICCIPKSAYYLISPAVFAGYLSFQVAHNVEFGKLVQYKVLDIIFDLLSTQHLPAPLLLTIVSSISFLSDSFSPQILSWQEKKRLAEGICENFEDEVIPNVDHLLRSLRRFGFRWESIPAELRQLIENSMSNSQLSKEIGPLLDALHSMDVVWFRLPRQARKAITELIDASIDDLNAITMTPIIRAWMNLRMVWQKIPTGLRDKIITRLDGALLGPSNLINLFQTFAWSKVKWADLTPQVQNSISTSMISFARHWPANSNNAAYSTLLTSFSRFAGHNVPIEVRLALTDSIRSELVGAPPLDAVKIMTAALVLGVSPNDIGSNGVIRLSDSFGSSKDLQSPISNKSDSSVSFDNLPTNHHVRDAEAHRYNMLQKVVRYIWSWCIGR